MFGQRLIASLGLDTSGYARDAKRVESETRKVAGSLARLEAAAKLAGRGLGHIGTAGRTAGTVVVGSMERIGVAGGKAANVIAKVDRNLTSLVSSGVQAVSGPLMTLFATISASATASAAAIGYNTIRLQGWEAALLAATGSEMAAAEALRFVEEQAGRLGLSLQSSIEGFTRLTAAAAGTALEGAGARDVFVAVAEAARVMNLGAADTEGVLRAVEQILSKGKLSAEELRLQLGDRLPGSFRIAAEAMGVTTAKLDDMLKKGQIMADDFLPKFAAQLRKSFGGGVEAAASNLSAEITRLRTELFKLSTDAGVGVADVLTQAAVAATGLVTKARGLLESIGGLNSVGRLAKRIWSDVTGVLGDLARGLGLNKLATGVLATTVRGAMRDFREWLLMLKNLEAAYELAKGAVKLFAADTTEWVHKIATETVGFLADILERYESFADAVINNPLASGAAILNPTFRNVWNEAKTGLDSLSAAADAAREATEKLATRGAAAATQLRTSAVGNYAAAADLIIRRNAEIEAGSETAADGIEDLATRASNALNIVESKVTMTAKKAFGILGGENIGGGVLKWAGEWEPAFAEWNREMAKVHGRTEDTTEATYGWRDALFDVADQMSTLPGVMGQVAEAMVQAISRWGDKATDKISAVGAALQTLGDFAMGDGSTNYGGELGGLGGLLGTGIGAIAGKGNPAAMQAGASLGQGIGTLLGSLFKKGLDDATAFITNEYISISGDSKLHDAVRAAGDTVRKIMSGLADSVGGALGDFEASIRQRGEKFYVYVLGTKSTFDSMEDAVQHLVTTLAKTEGVITDVSDNVAAALRNTAATTVQELERDLQVAMNVDRLGLNDFERGMRDLIDPLEELRRSAQRLGLDVTNVNQEIVASLAAERNAILGIEEDREAALRRRIDAYNAEVKAQRAALLVQKAELQAKMAMTDVDITRGNVNTEVYREMIRSQGVWAETSLAQAGAVASATVAMAQTGAEALAALDEALGSLSEITDADYEAALRRLRRQGGGGAGAGVSPAEQHARDVEALNDQFDRMLRGLLPGIGTTIAETFEQYHQLVEEARRLGEYEEEKYRELFALLQRELVDGILNRFASAENSPADRLLDMQDAIDQAFADLQEVADTVGGVTIDDVNELIERAGAAWKGLVEDIIGSLGLPMQDTRNRIKGLSETLYALRVAVAQSQMTTERYHEVVRELRNREFVSLGNDLLAFVDRYYSEMGIGEDLRQNIQRVQFQMELANLQLRYQLLVAEGLLVGEQYQWIRDVMDDISDLPIPDFTPPPPGGGGSGYTVPGGNGGGSSWQQAAGQIDDILQQMRDFVSSGAPQTAQSRLNDLRSQFEEWGQSIVDLGGNLNEANQLFREALRNLRDEILAPLLDLRDEILGSSTGPLSTSQRFESAQSAFQDIAARIASGDINAIADLPGVARTLQSAAAAMFGEGTPQFQAIQSQILALIRMAEGLDISGTLTNNGGTVGSSVTTTVPDTSMFSPVTDAVERNGALQIAELREQTSAVQQNTAELVRIRQALGGGGATVVS